MCRAIDTSRGMVNRGVSVAGYWGGRMMDGLGSAVVRWVGSRNRDVNDSREVGIVHYKVVICEN